MYTGPPASRTPSQSHGHRGCDTRPDSELQGPRTGHWERQRRPRRCLSTQRVLTKHLEDKLDNQRSGAKSPGLSHPHSPWETRQPFSGPPTTKCEPTSGPSSMQFPPPETTFPSRWGLVTPPSERLPCPQQPCSPLHPSLLLCLSAQRPSLPSSVRS